MKRQQWQQQRDLLLGNGRLGGMPRNDPTTSPATILAIDRRRHNTLHRSWSSEANVKAVDTIFGGVLLETDRSSCVHHDAVGVRESLTESMREHPQNR